MKRRLGLLLQMACVLLLIAANSAFAQAIGAGVAGPADAAVHGYASAVSLQAAVNEFNDRAGRDAVGKSQPPLTPVEVIAALRALAQNHSAIARPQYTALQSIAESGTMPKGAYLRFIPGLIAVNGFDIDVWWIDLQLDLDRYSTDLTERPMHDYRLRTVAVRSRRHTAP